MTRGAQMERPGEESPGPPISRATLNASRSAHQNVMPNVSGMNVRALPSVFMW
jgi:hypothetical protein